MVYVNEQGTESLAFQRTKAGQGTGWCTYHSPGVKYPNAMGTMIFTGETKLRFGYRFPSRGEPAPPQRPWEIRAMWFVALRDADWNTRATRTLPVSRLQASVNRPQYRRDLEKLIDLDWPISAGPAGGNPEWLLPPERIAQHAPTLVLDAAVGVRRKPTEFWTQVADAFLFLSAVGQAPAKRLAEENKVPVTTVHRWVKEARSQGVMPHAYATGDVG